LLRSGGLFFLFMVEFKLSKIPLKRSVFKIIKLINYIISEQKSNLNLLFENIFILEEEESLAKLFPKNQVIKAYD